MIKDCDNCWYEKYDEHDLPCRQCGEDNDEWRPNIKELRVMNNESITDMPLHP